MNCCILLLFRHTLLGENEIVCASACMRVKGVARSNLILCESKLAECLLLPMLCRFQSFLVYVQTPNARAGIFEWPPMDFHLVQMSRISKRDERKIVTIFYSMLVLNMYVYRCSYPLSN